MSTENVSANIEPTQIWTGAHWFAPLGRFFYSLIFLLSGFSHFAAPTIAYAAAQGVPMASIAVPLAGVISILGALSIMLGFKTRIGAFLILLFLVPVTLAMHKFWGIDDPMMHQMQMIQFMKNLSLMGAALFFVYVGSGPVSLDAKLKK